MQELEITNVSAVESSAGESPSTMSRRRGSTSSRSSSRPPGASASAHGPQAEKRSRGASRLQPPPGQPSMALTYSGPKKYAPSGTGTISTKSPLVRRNSSVM